MMYWRNSFDRPKASFLFLRGGEGGIGGVRETEDVFFVVSSSKSSEEGRGG